MRIESFHIDGYGALCDVGYDALAPGLVVALGPNEAGKTTLFDFLAGVLFGFPTRKTDPRFRPPTRGGRHGGRISFVDDAGGRWSVERYVTPAKAVHVRTPDGLASDEAALRRALAGASATLFRAVFAVGLDELGGMDSLSDDEVRELLFTASLLGQRSSATIAMRNLSDRCAGLARPRRGDALANRLASELELIRADLAAARQEAGRFQMLTIEADELDTAATATRARLRAATSRERELQLLVRAWPTQTRAEALGEVLAGMPAEDAPAIAQAANIRALLSLESGHRERIARLQGLRQEAAKQGHETDEALRRLGDDWTREQAASSVDPHVLSDHVRTSRQDLTRLATETASLAALLTDAEESLGLAATEAQELAAQFVGKARPAQRAALEKSLDAVDELHDRSGELERLENELTVRAQPSPPVANPVLPAPSWLPAIWVAWAGLVVVALTVVSLVERQGAIATAAAIVAALLVGVAGSLALQRRRAVRSASIMDGETVQGDGSSGSAATVELAERERQRVGQLAIELGLPVPPSRVDIERCAAALQRSMHDRRRLDDSATAVAGAARKAEAARDAHERCSHDIELKRQEFARWRNRHGLAGFTEPDETLEAIALLSDIRTRLQEIRRLGRVEESTAEEVESFATQVLEIANELDISPLMAAQLGSRTAADADAGADLDEAVAGAGLALAKLSDMLARAESDSSSRRALTTELAATEETLRGLFGEGSSARALATELSTGEIAAWESELEDMSAGVRGLEAAEEAAVRRHQSVSETIVELGTSDRIARLEQREAEVEADLDDALRQYLVLGAARSLLQKTLTHHEKERQPAVIASAAAHFASVTHGRYVSLVADADPEGAQSIRVVAASGAELDAACLSRGTIEQLYLCLRLGLADSFANRAVGLPMVLDDVLVNFDPERAASMAAELARTARERQIILMTCHPAMAELALKYAGESSAKSQLIELKRIA